MHHLLTNAVEPNTVQQARCLGVTTNFIYRRRQLGTISVVMADRLAVRLGYHPALVWGNDWWELAEHDMSSRTEQRAARNRRHRERPCD